PVFQFHVEQFFVFELFALGFFADGQVDILKLAFECFGVQRRGEVRIGGEGGIAVGGGGGGSGGGVPGRRRGRAAERRRPGRRRRLGPRFHQVGKDSGPERHFFHGGDRRLGRRFGRRRFVRGPATSRPAASATSILRRGFGRRLSRDIAGDGGLLRDEGFED